MTENDGLGDQVDLEQRPEDLLVGEVMAVAYVGYREGQRVAGQVLML